jgi:hypothetical protein
MDFLMLLSATSNFLRMILQEASTSKLMPLFPLQHVRDSILYDIIPCLTTATELGIDLGTIGFQAFFGGTHVGRKVF